MMKKIFFVFLFLFCAADFLSAQIIVSTNAGGNYSIPSYPGNFTAYYDGFSVVFKADHTSSGAVTMNIAGVGAKPIVNTAGNNLAINDILINQIVILYFDAVNNRFQMITTSGNTGGGGIAGTGTASYLTRWATASTLGNSLIYDDGTNVTISGDNGDGAYKLAIGKNASSIEKVLSLTNTNSIDGAGTAIGFRSLFISTLWDQARISGVTSNGISQGSLIFETMNNRSTNSLIEAMRITGAGKVGIGTINPQTSLHVSGGSGNYNGNLLRLEGDYTSVNNYQQFDFARTADGAAVAGIRSVFSSAGEWSMDFFGTTGGTPFSTNIIRMQGNGNVGIGTTVPTAKLEVNGQVKITDGSQSAGAVLTSDGAGNGTWTNNYMIMACTPNAAGAGTNFTCPFNNTGNNPAENTRQMVVPTSFTVNKMYVFLSSAQPATTTTIITLRKNTTDTPVVLTINPNTVIGAYFITGFSALFAPGDLLSFKLVSTGGGSGTIVSLAISAY